MPLLRLSGKGRHRKEMRSIRCFQSKLETIISVVEEEIDRTLDRYEEFYEGTKREAAERMHMGYFDSGVALLGRVAVWNDDVDAWNGWKGTMLERQDDLED